MAPLKFSFWSTLHLSLENVHAFRRCHVSTLLQDSEGVSQPKLVTWTCKWRTHLSLSHNGVHTHRGLRMCISGDYSPIRSQTVRRHVCKVTDELLREACVCCYSSSRALAHGCKVS
eukprot:1750537-Amphidinium_carterae.2